MAFTDLHEIEETFASLSVFDISGTGWYAKLSVDEMHVARMEHQQSPRGAELHRKNQAAYRARHRETLLAKEKAKRAEARAARPPKPVKLCSEGCGLVVTARGLCCNHYRKHRAATEPDYLERLRAGWRAQDAKRAKDPTTRETRRAQKAAYRERKRLDAHNARDADRVDGALVGRREADAGQVAGGFDGRRDARD